MLETRAFCLVSVICHIVLVILVKLVKVAALQNEEYIRKVKSSVCDGHLFGGRRMSCDRIFSAGESGTFEFLIGAIHYSRIIGQIYLIVSSDQGSFVSPSRLRQGTC